VGIIGAKPRTSGRIVQAACLAASVALAECATRQNRPLQNLGIPSCPDEAGGHLLSADALQCWFTASHGRWRTLNHQSHLEALVVEVESQDLRDAVAIAQRVVADPMAGEFSEILVYVAQPERGELRVRRVQWTRGGRFETLDFSSQSGDTPLTIRSSPGSPYRP
jgi:hypothetical protein